MITFLPYESFHASAACLDHKRIWKQVLEANQILKILDGAPSRYENHPAVLMWEDYESALLMYRDAVVAEWVKRRLVDPPAILCLFTEAPMPPWLGDERVHRSHRSALLAKMPDHYGQFAWDVEPMDLSQNPFPYFWPVKR